MTYEDELWNLAFSNVGRLHGEPQNQRDVSRAIQTISGFGPSTNQQRQMTTGRARVTQPAGHARTSARTSQSHNSVGSSSRTSQQYAGTNSSQHQYVYWQPNVKGSGAANHNTPSQYNYPASHGVPGRRPRSSYGAAQPWRLSR